MNSKIQIIGPLGYELEKEVTEKIESFAQKNPEYDIHQISSSYSSASAASNGQTVVTILWKRPAPPSA